MWKRPSILMLGWEYPPYFNGGLGVACHGLSNALSSYVDISMIVPKAGENQQAQNVQVIDIQQVSLQKEKEKEGVQPPATFAQWEKHWVEETLNPYATSETPVINDNTDVLKKDNLYAGDLKEKVRNYTQQVVELFENKPFELIHAHDWMTFPAAIALKEKTGKPLVIHVHSTEYDRSGGRNDGFPWVSEIEKDAMQKADAIIAVSKYSAKILCDQFGADENKVFVVHNGVEKKTIFHTKKDFPEKLVTFLGRVTVQKSPDIFFNVALKVLEQYDNVRFVVAGKGGRLAEMMENAAKHKVSEKFHFAGFLEKAEVNHLLSMTDIFVMPSASEPFGMAAMEAAQFGIPCIISRQSGCLEVIKGALTADWKDVDLMADYVTTLLNSPALAQEIGRHNQESVQDATWENSAAKVLDVYANLLKPRKGELIM